jgi:hypothetical protein
MEDINMDDEEDDDDDTFFDTTTTTTPAPTSTVDATSVPVITTNSGSSQSSPQYALLPFTISIHDEQRRFVTDPNVEPFFRRRLEEYVVTYFKGRKVDDDDKNNNNNEFVSNVLDSIQLEPYTIQTSQGGRARQLQQEDPSSAATSIGYQGIAILSPSAGFYDYEPTMLSIQESQITALEDLEGLQEYYIEWFLLQEQTTEDDDDLPIIVWEVQVGDRPPTTNPDPIETLDRIESLVNPDAEEEEDDDATTTTTTDTDTAQDGVDAGGPNTTVNSTTAAKEGTSSWVVGLVLGIVSILLVLLVGFFCMRRFKRRSMDQLNKLPGAPDVHAMEVASDADSDDYMEEIIYDKSLLRESQRKSSSSSPDPSIVKQSNTSSSDEEEDDDDDNNSERKNNKSGRFSLGRISSLFRKNASSSADDNAHDEDGTAPVIVSSGSDGTTPANDSNESFEMQISEHVEIAETGRTSRVSAPGPAIDLTKPGRNSKGIFGKFQRELPSPRRRTASPQEIEEFDSYVASMHICSVSSYDEEESMMGYSLASGYEVREKTNNNNNNNNNTSNESISVFSTNTDMQQTAIQTRANCMTEAPALRNDEHHGDGDSHASSNDSEPSYKNPLFAGVQNLLNSSNDSGNLHQSKNKKWYGQLGFGKKNRPQGFVSSDSESVADTLEQILDETASIPDECSTVYIEEDVEGEQEVVILNTPDVQNMIPHHPPHSEDEAVSSYKEMESEKGCDSSVMSGYSSASLSDADPIYHLHTGAGALGYFKPEDMSEIDQLPQITPAPSEEMDEMAIKTPVLTNHMGSNAAPDDASDAPSDERHNGGGRGQNGSPQSFLNIPVVENTDPAVVEYLMKERRNAKQRTRRKREDRKQPPVTMEV